MVRCVADIDGSVQIERSRLAELERRSADTERLQRELAEARAEIARLKGEVQSARHAVAQPWIPSVVQAAARKLPPTPEITSLPQLASQQVIPVHDLLNHFSSDPAAAAKRYGKKVIRVRGFITDLDKPIFQADYAASLRLPEQELRVVAGFVPPRELTRVYVTTDRERIVGETAQRRATLLQVGTEVLIEGFCNGLKNHEVRLDGCKLLPLDAP